jgi:hypothetical protein
LHCYPLTGLAYCKSRAEGASVRRAGERMRHL